MKDYIKYFIGYVTIEKDASPQTIHKYRSDLTKFQNYLKIQIALLAAIKKK